MAPSTGSKPTWLTEPEPHDFEAADQFLRLVLHKRRVARALERLRKRRTKTRSFAAKVPSTMLSTHPGFWLSNAFPPRNYLAGTSRQLALIHAIFGRFGHKKTICAQRTRWVTGDLGTDQVFVVLGRMRLSALTSFERKQAKHF